MQRQLTYFTRRGAVLGIVGFLLTTTQLLAKASNQRTLLIVGDSLSAEYGLPRGSGWVSLLESRLVRRGMPVRVVNASISGETTAGGRTRLASLLKQHRPSHVILELGGNDALRGFPLRSTQENLNDMTQASLAAGAKVLLVGMQVPPNYGKRYSDDFAAMFARVAKERSVALVPFLLKGVADRPDSREWFQPDGIHPLSKAQPVMLDNIWQELNRML